MERLIFATGNAHKMKEIREILGGLPVGIVSMKEAGIDLEIEETGSSFEENALIKARAVAAVSGALTLADDSGLEIDALGGAPGIYSSRFLGEDTPYSEKNRAIIEKLAGLSGSERSARFRCVIAAVFPDGRELVSEGRVEGEIAFSPAGENGFGYDPIFYLPERGCTTAELSAEEKNAISHRGRALRGMVEKLAAVLDKEEG